MSTLDRQSPTPAFSITTRRTTAVWPTLHVAFMDANGAVNSAGIEFAFTKCEIRSVDEEIGAYPRRLRPCIVCTSDQNDSLALWLLFPNEDSAWPLMAFLESNRDGEVSAPILPSEICFVRGNRTNCVEEQFALVRVGLGDLITPHDPRPGLGMLLIDTVACELPTWIAFHRINCVRRYSHFVIFTDRGPSCAIYVLLCQCLEEAELVSERLESRAMSFCYYPCQVFRFDSDDPVQEAWNYALRRNYAAADEWPELKNSVNAYWKLFRLAILQARGGGGQFIAPSISDTTSRLQNLQGIILRFREREIGILDDELICAEQGSEQADEGSPDLENCEAGISEATEHAEQWTEALLAIKRRRLYQTDYRTFAEYCQVRWGFDVFHAPHFDDTMAPVPAHAVVGSIEMNIVESDASLQRRT